VFWVISVKFDLRNALPKLGPFLLGHPVYISVETVPSPKRFRSSSEPIFWIRGQKSISEHRIFPSLIDGFSNFRLELRNVQKEELCVLLGYHLEYRLLTDVLGQPIESGDPRRNISCWIS
jgi:hypothetical protein